MNFHTGLCFHLADLCPRLLQPFAKHVAQFQEASLSLHLRAWRSLRSSENCLDSRSAERCGSEWATCALTLTDSRLHYKVNDSQCTVSTAGVGLGQRTNSLKTSRHDCRDHTPRRQLQLPRRARTDVHYSRWSRGLRDRGRAQGHEEAALAAETIALAQLESA